ncbi:hypothetical protein BDW59DRAFT_148615 [Aspergillus cavernicola]|uniref:NmrA-like domain-containing protein n=1 Tax=Aspergillus cavernicola TaxID=176166 RepID=A0ABR4I6Q8_9EURO
MGKQTVLLLGATGSTGGSILEGLLSAGHYDIQILVRPSSVTKDSVKKLVERGIKVRVSDLDASESNLASVLTGIDTFISAIGPRSLLQQKTLVRAAKTAGVKRFIPCAWITIAPPKGVMLLRDEKEEIYNEIKLLSLPYTIIDVGFWYQFSFPPVPSGRVDYALSFSDTTIHAGGNAPNLLTDLRDIGRFVARIISDDRTLNRYVYTYGDVLSENEVFGIVEEVSREEVQRVYESASEIENKVHDAVSYLAENPTDPISALNAWIAQYPYSKYVRQDNQPRFAKYLGYLDARELYPDFKPVSFREYFEEVLAGKAGRVVLAEEMPSHH